MQRSIAVFIFVLVLLLVIAAGGASGATDPDPASGPQSGDSSHGKDSLRMRNLCANGDFEQLQEAAARPLPQDWQEFKQGLNSAVDVSGDTAQGKHALHLKAEADGAAGANSATIAAGRGVVKLRYKALKSSVDGANLTLNVIGLSGPSGTEITRQTFSPPKEHVGDGNWHEAKVEFDFLPLRVRNCLIGPRVNETQQRGDGEWLIDNVEVYANEAGPQIRIAQVWSDKPLARTGDKIRFSAFIGSTGDAAVKDLKAELTLSAAVTAGESARRVPNIPAGSYQRIDWVLNAESSGTAEVEVTASIDGKSGPITDKKSYRILVIDRSAKYTRQELCTDDVGYWRILERPTTLQEGNTGAIAPVKHRKSSEIKHNPYGICTHVPRSKDYEDPFNPSHLIDGDPETCWSSQQNPSPYPGSPPWAQIDLGRAFAVKQINLIPYWRNTDFPVGFSVHTSLDGKKWETALNVTDHVLADSGEKRGNKLVQLFPITKPVNARYVKVDFEVLPLSAGNYAEVSQGYKARLSGIEVIDDNGQNVALKSQGAGVKCSDYFTGWQNTAKTVNESFDRIFDIGLKWVRIGQWGDQTEWAAVERRKGEFHVDPVTDAGIRKLYENGVDILYGLNYGNSLYEPMDKPWGDVGPIYTEGHPFYKNGGPRTEEGRQAFARYTDFVVRKYKKEVKYWELWNEENGWYPGFEPELYGKLLLTVAKQVKTSDPNALVMFGGTAAPAPVISEISLREGATPYVDLTAFHPYGIDKPEGGMGTMEVYQGKSLGKSREQTGWDCLEKVVEGVREPFAKHGKPNIGVWLNEWGTNVSGLDFTYKPGIGEYGCAKWMTRFYIYNGWLGHPMAWWALYNLNKSQDWGIVEQSDYGFRPMSYALQNVCSVVSDVEPVRSLDYTYEGQAPDLKVISYKRDGSGDTLVLVWAAELNTEQVRSYPSKLSFALDHRPGRVTMTDLYWGVFQPAVWSYEDGRVTLDRLIVRDYPVVVTCD